MAFVKEMRNGRYRVIVSIGNDGTGKRIRKTTTIDAKSLEEANFKAEQMEEEVRNGKTYNFNHETFSSLIDTYIKNTMNTDETGKGINKAISTISKDLNTINEIRKHLGKYKLQNLTQIAVSDYITSLSQDGARRDNKPGGLSPKTIKNRLGLISNICQYGYDNGFLKGNPCVNIKKPKQKKKNVESYTDEEVKKLQDALSVVDIKHKTMIYTTLICGLRRSELMGLEWSDIDFERRYISIRRGSQYISHQGTMETDLKTDTSHRIIAIPDSLVNMLKKYKEWLDNERIKAEDLWYESNRLFVGDTGQPYNPDSISQWWSRFLKRSGLRVIPFHALRHTSISMLISNGEDIVEVSHRAGHSNVSTTLNVYSHLFKKLNRSSADIMEQALF